MIVENSDKSSRRCRCPGYPTHDDCMKKDDERLGGRYFCIEGVAR